MASWSPTAIRRMSISSEQVARALGSEGDVPAARQTLALVDGSLAHTSSSTQADSRRNKGPKSRVTMLSMRSTRVISVTPQTDVPPKPVKILFAQVIEASDAAEAISILKAMPVDPNRFSPVA
jgi:hypothetical protein